MHLQKIGLLLVPLFAFGVSTPVLLSVPALSTTPQALAQTPDKRKLDPNPAANSAVTGSFVDYYAEEIQLKGHEGSVKSASFSPDGKRIVTASFDGTARVWDLSGKQLVELTGHEGYVYSASFSPDGGRIVTAGADKTARVWEASGQLLVEMTGQ